ncbi:hypothetical protein JCM11641_003690 [Rhodosporidiobolus odoratus]
MWRTYLVCLDDEHKTHLEGLIESGCGRQHIRQLHLSDTDPEQHNTREAQVVSDQMLQVAKTFVCGCSRLESLFFKVFGPAKEPVEAILLSISSRHVTPLFLGMMLLEIADHGPSTMSASASLHLEEFNINLSPVLAHEGAMACLGALEAALDPSTLRRCQVEIAPSVTAFIHFLAICPSLGSLIPSYCETTTLSDTLPSLLPIVPSFPSLSSLTFSRDKLNLREGTAELPSPISPLDFLQALPSSIKDVLLTSTYSNWSTPSTLPTLPVTYLNAILPVLHGMVLCFGQKDETAVVDRAMVAKLPISEQGSTTWVRLCWVRRVLGSISRDDLPTCFCFSAFDDLDIVAAKKR